MYGVFLRKFSFEHSLQKKKKKKKKNIQVGTIHMKKGIRSKKGENIQSPPLL